MWKIIYVFPVDFQEEEEDYLSSFSGNLTIKLKSFRGYDTAFLLLEKDLLNAAVTSE
jgi:hypothetical protein